MTTETSFHTVEKHRAAKDASKNRSSLQVCMEIVTAGTGMN